VQRRGETAPEAMMQGNGHSLWLMPTGEAYEKFSGLIKHLAQAYHGPVFEPHVTLLGGVRQAEDEIFRGAAQLVSGQQPFPIILRTVEYQDVYFRALFVRAERTEPLQAFYTRAKELFAMPDLPEYLPHLSLMYGNFPQPVKEHIIQAIGRDHTTEFPVSSVHVFNTAGEAHTWCRVKELPFV
jgi:2'-5' RNA ligase